MMFQIYCFWTGPNAMSDNRLRCLKQFKETCGFPVQLVTPRNLHKFIIPSAPLHAAYPYLSETHKADYLRTYFMHFWGGGYTDIKKTTDSWAKAFQDLLLHNNQKWICGYPEIEGGVAYEPVYNNWAELIGNCAYICKPLTPLTTEWYNEMITLLDTKLVRLRQYPSSHPQDCNDGSSETGYPIEWNEMLGRIFHKETYKYKAHLLNTLPKCIFSEYR